LLAIAHHLRFKIEKGPLKRAALNTPDSFPKNGNGFSLKPDNGLAASSGERRAPFFAQAYRGTIT
jgi:hypothetical protein